MSLASQADQSSISQPNSVGGARPSACPRVLHHLEDSPSVASTSFGPDSYADVRLHSYPRHVMLELNDLLRGESIAPESVLVLRHRPHERKLNRVMPWLASARPDLYNTYQQSHGEQLERAMYRMTRTGYLASFLGRRPGQALFVGLYEIGRARPMTHAQYWRLPAHRELRTLGMEGFTKSPGRSSLLWFELTPVDFYSNWKGKLTVGWPPPERSWWRRAHRNEMPVLSILEDSALEQGVPGWQEISLTWDHLKLLPMRWRDTLSQWRGVYHILDESDGKRYVGSAAGKDNLLGRWLNYAKSGHGGNRLLRQRDPKHFTFTILQLVSPDLDPGDISAIEASWKRRLQTRAPQGLNDN